MAWLAISSKYSFYINYYPLKSIFKPHIDLTLTSCFIAGSFIAAAFLLSLSLVATISLILYS